MSPGRVGPAGRLFRASLVLFPRWFRAEYGEDMVATFEERAEQLRAGGGALSLAAFTLRALLEVPLAALQVRRGLDLDLASFLEGSSSAWLDDLRHAARSLRRAPAWTAASLLILALGIGGTTALFSVINSVFLRPLPYASPDRLVSIWTLNRGQRDGSSWANASDWLERSRALEEIALVVRPEFTMSTVTGPDGPERIHVGLVSPTFFELLGAEASVGRVFGPADEGEGAQIVVIGEDLWGARFGRDPDVVGRTVTIEGTELDIVGVVPSDLAIPRRETQIWQLWDVAEQPGAEFRQADAYWVLGRLRSGVAVEAARAELQGIASQLATEYPDTNRELGVRLTSLRTEIVGDRLPLLLGSLFGSMVLVLLIGGANVAQLMLGRGTARRRELAVRGSLGATRARLTRQLLAESVLLSAVAGIGGVAIARVSLPILIASIPSDVPLIEATTMDLSVLAFAVLTVGVMAPLVGLLPAIRAPKASVADVLRSGGRGSTVRDRRLRSALVVGELALAVLLLSGASLLLRSAVAVSEVDPGFDAERALIMRLNLSLPDDDAILAAEGELVRRVRAVPGVEDVGLTGGFFVERIPDQRLAFTDEDPPAPGTPAPPLTSEGVFPGFFEAIGAPLLAGRRLALSDVPVEDERVVTVNASWVRSFSPDRDPIGRQFRRVVASGPIDPTFTVVGVVGDLRHTELEAQPFPQIFYPETGIDLDLVVRTSGDPLGVAPLVRTVVRQLDPGAAVSGVGRLSDRYRDGMAPRRFQTYMVGLLAAFATLLAAVGLFAILHDMVSARRREVGIRIALGAEPRRVLGMVLGSGLAMAMTGLVLGLGLALLLSGVTARFVYGIESTDPVSLATVAVLLLATALVASGLPAWRATAVSPTETLNDE